MSKWKIQDVYYDSVIAGDLVPHDADIPLCRAMSYLPDDVAHWISKNVLFIEQERDPVAYWYPVKGRKGLILIPNSLWEKEDIEISFVIAHEVAHAFLGHMKTDKKNEINADKLAVQWLSPHFDKKKLRKLCNGWKE